MSCRDHTPLLEDCTEKLKTDAQRYYDRLIALGGRPTRPIQSYPNCNTTAGDGKLHYRDEYEKMEVIFEVDKYRSSSHWADEMGKWDCELLQWERFKEAQRIHNQYGRSEVELELENTDAALIGVLSKLNDWREFESLRRRDVHEAEKLLDECQQGKARTHNAMFTAVNADPMIEVQEPSRGWMSSMRDAQEKLDASQKKLMWVESQWTEVLEEACSSIAAAPKLQEQLEAKFEKQARAIHRALLQKGARPSRKIFSPNRDAAFPQRLQHWISESSVFTAELRDWKVFMIWRRKVRDAGNMDQDGRKVLSEGDSWSERFEDLVKYQQRELEKAASWVNCWRRQARQYKDVYMNSSLYDVDDLDNDSDDDSEEAEAKRAELYARQAEVKVSIAAKRLEQSKQRLRGILADSASCSASKAPTGHTEVQTPPTPPKFPLPEAPRKSRRSLKQKGSGGKGYRRSKKEITRKGEAKMANTDTEQLALPEFSLGSYNMNESNEDIQMSDDTEHPSPVEIKKESNKQASEDAVMSDVEERPDQPPLSLAGSHPRPVSRMSSTHFPSPSSPSPISRRTRSATKLDQAPSGKILKKSSKNRPTKKAKVFTEEQELALLIAAATEHPAAAPTSLGRSKHHSYPTRSTSTHNSQTSSRPSSQPTTSRKTRTAKGRDRVPPAGKIHKKSNKNKPRKKAKTFTEEQTQILFNAATSNCHSTGPTSPEKSVVETYPTLHTSANKDTKPPPGSPSLTSGDTLSTIKPDHIPLRKAHKDSNTKKSRKEAKNPTEQQTSASTNAASASWSSTYPGAPRRSERLKKKAAAGKGRV